MPRTPIHVDHVLDDPDRIRKLVLANSPYWPVYRYFSDAVELAASGAPVRDLGAPMQVPPWFRGDWADTGPLVPGVEPILLSTRFARAARELYGLSGNAVIRPQLVYVNLMLPMPAADRGHTDVPAFRGIRRDRFPVWLLSVMGHSRLFERWRIRIATAVSWWYDGVGGQFTCWPDGPDAAPVVIPARSNTAIIGENESMFHRVERVGTKQAELQLDGLTPGAELAADAGSWQVREQGRTLARVCFEDIRISVSWKAEIFEDPEEAHTADAHLDDLSIDQVWRMLAGDLKERGIDAAPGEAPLPDARFITALGQTYTRAPTHFPEP